jgi:Sulfotransferase domain
MADLAFFQWIWPLPSPSKVRTTKRMQVLALGLPRTGTDSLKKALQDLGYERIYHGYDILDHFEDNVAWCELVHQQQTGGVLDAEAFDMVLGDCEGVSDVPAVRFWKELIDAYPEAKIVVNYRKDPVSDAASFDLESWHE